MDGLHKPTVTVKVKFKGSKLATGSSKMPAAVVSVPFMRKLTALNKSMLEFTANSAYKKPKSAAPSSTTSTTYSGAAGDATGRPKRRKIGDEDSSIPASAPSLASAHPSVAEATRAQNEDGVLLVLRGDGDEAYPSAAGAPIVGGLCLPASHGTAATASRFYTPQWTRKQHNKNIESIDPDTMVITCDYDLWLLLEAQKVFAPFSYKTHDMSVLNLQDTGSAEVLARWAVPPLTGSRGGGDGSEGTSKAEGGTGAGVSSSSARTSIAIEGSGAGGGVGSTSSGVHYAPPSSSGAGSAFSSGAAPSAPVSVSWLHPSPNGYNLPPASLGNTGGYAPYGSMLAGLPEPTMTPAYLPQAMYGAPQTIYGAAPQGYGYGYPMPPGYASVMGYPGIPAVASSSGSGVSTSGWLGPSGGGGGVGGGGGGVGGQLPPLLSLLAQSRGAEGSIVAGGNVPPLLPTLWPSAHKEVVPGARREEPSIAPPPTQSVLAKEDCEIDEEITQMEDELRAQQLENNRRIASLRRDTLQTAPVRRELEDQQKQIERERAVLHRWRKTNGYIPPGSRKGINSGGAGSGNGANGAAGKVKHVHRKKHGGY